MLNWLWKKKDTSSSVLSTKSVSLWSRIKSIFDGGYAKSLEEILLNLEDLLISQDVGIEVAEKIIAKVRSKTESSSDFPSFEHLLDILKGVSYELIPSFPDQHQGSTKPTVVFFVGINGVGKTTTMAKVAYKESLRGKKILLAAADTFRAAATEQLAIWADRVGVDIVKGTQGSDPSSVVYNAVEKAQKENYDLLLVDTAGRLHNKIGLMNELAKMKRSVVKILSYPPQEILLVVDSTTGQNAFEQVQTFKEVVDVSGLVLTKADGVSKGGVGLGLTIKYNIPIKYLGFGETKEDLQDFSKDLYIEGLFSNN